MRKNALRSQCERAEQQLDRVSTQEVDARYGEDARQRMLKHSAKVRDTLAIFKTQVISKHAKKIESLMLESFQALLRKADLVSGLTIDPKSFAVTLLDRVGKPLPFDRLSAGERQLLATSMLWGLARASGRPVPTIIDTPLGRLDSSHRKHLIERYFPFASHQVLLLSTDEEIVGDYHTAISPFVTRSYHLAHDEELGSTSVTPATSRSMKPPVENVRISSKARDALIQAKRHTGLKQWNELLRWAFCLSLANADPPKVLRQLDSGMDPVEWITFAGKQSHEFSALFYVRAAKDGIDITDPVAVSSYFRAHIERGVASLRSLKSLTALVSLTD